MSALAGLNSEQLESVKVVDRHLLVVAGAGSGKTRVLTHKIAHLIEDHGIRPYEILAMTFSNRAANEMVERIRLLLPSFDQPRAIGTFHSMCLRILKEHAAEAQLSSHFTIYDETDQLTVIKRILKDLDLDPKKYVPQAIRHHIDRAKNETERVTDYLRDRNELPDLSIRVAEKYEETLRNNNALDFGDLLIRTVRLIRRSEKVRDSLRTRYKRILVDEYQDTNQIQKELVQELAGTSGVVCAVGDEDQSIYSWRGARVENMLEFETDFPGAQVIKLERNYRSTQQVLDVANAVISHNVGRRKKNLWTEHTGGDRVRFIHTEDDYGEVRTVLDEVEQILREGMAPANEIAIFYRTNAQSRLFEDECRRRNVHYRIFGGIRFYDRAEVKDVLAFLKLALNPTDNVSFNRIINVPARGIGDKTIDRIAYLADQRGCSYMDAIPYLEGNGKAEKALRTFLDWFTVLRSDLPNLTPDQSAEIVLQQSGYSKALENEGTIEAESRLENIQELLRSMQEYVEAEKEQPTLAAYLDRISLVSDLDQYDQSLDSITMMTVHNAKGLEFDAVFVSGMEEGIFPHHRSMEEDSGRDNVEEERRLCYVAMTRARKRLLLTAAARRKLYQSTQFNPVSRFIEEVPAQLIEKEERSGYMSSSDLRLSQFSYWGRARTTFSKREPDEFRQESYEDPEDRPARHVWSKAAHKAAMRSPYPPGARVKHAEFGLGTVQKCEGNEGNLKVTVQFQRGGTKKLSLNFCSLELVDR
jgi:DNA helicase II / ATP-dependent DNA helicase PcrA